MFGHETEIRLLVCGSRNFQNKPIIKELLGLFRGLSVVIHGDARGADRLAGKVATELGISVMAFPAQWNNLGRAAGVIRNTLMLRSKPNRVLALFSDVGASIGTANMVYQALGKGLAVRCYEESEKVHFYATARLTHPKSWRDLISCKEDIIQEDSR